MKYCPQCGNHVYKNQRFCNQCGYNLEVFEQYRNQMTTTPKRKKWPFIVIAILVIAIIVAACSTYYYFFVKPVDTPKKETPTYQVSKKEKESEEGKVSNDPEKAEKEMVENSKSNIKYPKIDVLTEDFKNNFMEKDTRDGYKGIKKRMTRVKVEEVLGKSPTKFEYSDFYGYKYGNLAVLYSEHNEGTVASMGVAPGNLSVDEFIKYYPKYTERYPNMLIYNNNIDNGFKIIVSIKNNKVHLITCADDEDR